MLAIVALCVIEVSPAAACQSRCPAPLLRHLVDVIERVAINDNDGLEFARDSDRPDVLLQLRVPCYACINATECAALTGPDLAGPPEFADDCVLFKCATTLHCGPFVQAVYTSNLVRRPVPDQHRRAVAHATQ